MAYHDNNLTYKELKEKVSIIDVATYLGYKNDIKKGKKQPYFDCPGKEPIYITNPNENSIQGYWTRGGDKGDLISFVKKHLDSFPDNETNPTIKLNKILHRFAKNEYKIPEFQKYNTIYTPQEFDKNRYIQNDNIFQRNKILEQRQISLNTYLKFAKYIHLVYDNNSKYKVVNIAFPYRIPEDNINEIRGYEIRGLNGYKSKATGTDSTRASWIADFSIDSNAKKNIFIFESGFDALSFYQLYNDRIDLNKSVFVSFGGAFSDTQAKNIINAYPNSKFILGFDNDTMGNIFDMKFNALKKKEDFNIQYNDDKYIINNKEYIEPKLAKEDTDPNIAIFKSKNAKDFNEMLQNQIKKSQTKNYGY